MWPEGYVRREIETAQASNNSFATKFAWHSNGYSKHTESSNLKGVAEKRSCLGVFTCTHCHTPARPKTRKPQEQFSEGCKCGGAYTWTRCNANAYYFPIKRDGVEYLVWEHKGSHMGHERPPGGRLTGQEWEEVGKQVARNHEASALQLRTGDLGPGSVPLGKIAPSLSNARAARYAMETSRSAQGIASKSQNGVAGMLHSFTTLRKELSTPFMMDSGIDGPVYTVMYTPFMEIIVKESVHDWIESSDEGESVGRHGFVTDGDHKFFRSGNLLVTAAWSPSLLSWVPIVYSWVDTLDGQHHRPHFRALFRMIMKHAGGKFDKKLFLNVCCNVHF